jgi:branched-chain amino acid transport system ATP-binding protein
MRQVPQNRPLLLVQDLSVCYKDILVLKKVGLTVWPQQIVAIVGPNGSGKTTLLKAIAGLLPVKQGNIFFHGQQINSLHLSQVVQQGLVYVPEGMSVFPDMTVLENLEIGAYLHRGGMKNRLTQVYELFPELYEKRGSPAGTLSGGQQRMVTLGRGLMSGAHFLLLDDPFLGLSPKIIKRFCDTIRSLRESGKTLFIAGQHVRRLLTVADVALLIENGGITLTGTGAEVLNNDHLQQILFGIDSTHTSPRLEET